jgi:hypothetical protein
MSGLTANYNNYSAAELEKALQSWVEPYPKPIILNHDLNSEPIGRVMAAKMEKEQDGAAYVRLQIAITDPVAAQKIADKRYLTGSVGGRAGKAVCSISGEDLAKEDASGKPKFPKYKRGQVYKGKLAFIDMQDISFKEYSFVNQPADQRSGVRNAKTPGNKVAVEDSDTWVAKSSAFVLHMDQEDIISLQENESILKNMKKKESRPVYLHTKGAFLAAMAVQESENINSTDKSLLFNKDSNSTTSEENISMEDVQVKEDILAVAEELSQDLSTIAATATDKVEEKPADEKTAEEQIEQPAEEQKQEEISNDNSEKAEEQAEEAVDSEKAEESSETSAEKADVQNPEKEEIKSDDLTAQENKGNEQGDDESQKLVKSLQEENARLKAALHKTLAERVVDTKIALGLESASDRDKLVEDHATRTASSLADSLRDLAKLPEKKTKSFEVPTMESELAVAQEENVVTVDEKQEEKEVKAEGSFEQLFVDALMGRRKL